MGSNNEVNKVLLEKQTKATETLDCFIDSKNVTQCNAIISPTPKVFKSCFLVICNENSTRI